MPDPLLNTSLGPYRIIAELGRGGMAVVYKGIQPALSREVAIKVLPPYFAHDPNFVERFKREAQNAARLKHPNIVVIHDVGEAQGYHFIVMEMLEGATLQQIIQRAGVLSLERAAKILEQIASALDYAHARGFIHRDIKPSNIIVGENDFATLTDFGIAKAIEGSSFTSTGAAIGTPAYMSPEQARGEKNIDHRTDIYSLGVVAYEMVSGRVPFTGDTTPAILHKVIYEPLPSLRLFNPRVSERVEQTISKALAKQREQRFARAAELASALSVRSEVKPPPPELVTEFVPPRETKPVQSSTPKPVTPIVPPRAPKQTPSRFPFLLAGVGGCAILLALVALGFVFGIGRVNPPVTSTPSDPIGLIRLTTNDPIQIAYMLVVTGIDGTFGVDSRRGIEIAIDDRGGKVLDRTIKLDGQDSGCNAEGGQAAAAKLAANATIVAVIGSSCSSEMRAGGPILSKAGFTFISPSNTAPDLTEPSKRVAGYFRTSWSDAVQGTAVAQFTLTQLKSKTAATISDGSPYADGLAKAFQDAFEKGGGKITAKETASPADKDARVYLTRISSAKPDMLFYPVFISLGVVITQQSKQILGDKIVLISSDGTFSSDFIKGAGTTAIGVYQSSPDFSSFAPEYGDFSSKYQKKYNEKPGSAFPTAYAYDATNILFAAIEKVAVKGTDGTISIGRQALRDAVAATKNFKGLTGTLSCDADGNCGSPQISIYQVSADNVSKVETPSKAFWSVIPNK